ncbi:aminopeptidase P family protein [Paenibacillus frigoriresistens]|uniref:M24 family metallopeptidase n=1 Tax=Paenibacillus alginolyticus TaxID=59839 RepID=UPI0015674A0C|nr:Xaa-Pro peptidase family protein [Paenibacillus frigoriresistens]NRF93213.1 aminopeptidase P family protein [Paenibacillus frigoriresistens]
MNMNPSFAINSSLHEIPVEEYMDRVRRTQEEMRKEGYDLIIAWSDSYRMSNVRWLSNYRAFDGIFPYPAIVIVPVKGDPILFVESSLTSIGAASVVKDVRGIRQDLGPVLEEYAASGNVKKVGIAGYKYLALEFWSVIQKSLPDIQIEPTIIIDFLKSIKSENEIRNMKVAGYLADLGIEAIREAAREGATEKELTKQAYLAMFANGSDTVAFDIMVQTGENSSDFYLARPTDRKLKDGDTLLIDMGCRYNGYASDMARGATFGSVSKEVEAMFDAALEAYETGFKYLRPGLTGEEASYPANEVLAKYGYIHSPGEGRGVGHGLGMDPEEELPILAPGMKSVLQENQTLAYVITLLIPGVGGLRIEDSVVIRKDGAESMTNFSYHNNW